MLKSILKIAEGAVESAAIHQLKNDKRLRSRNAKRARQAEEGCMPCAASAYVMDLRQFAKGARGR